MDSHAHLMQDPFHYMESMPVDDFIALLDDAEVQKTVLFTLTGLVRDFQRHNDELADFVARHPDRLVGLGTVNPWYGDGAVQEAERCFVELAFAGLKFSPWNLPPTPISNASWRSTPPKSSRYLSSHYR